MEKWSIRPAPTSFDPLRHVLLIKGSMKDVSALLRRFGALCGRPSPKGVPEGFNFSIPLHSVTTSKMERLSLALNEMSGGHGPGGLALRVLPGVAPAPPAPIAPAEAPPPEPLPQPPAPPAAASLVPAPEPPIPAAFPAAAPEIPLPAVPELNPPQEAPPPVVLTPPPELVSLAPPVIQPPPQEPAPSPAMTITTTVAVPVEPAPPAPALAAADLAPALVAAAAAAPIPEQLKPFWGFEAGFDPLQTFDTLLVGPYNRFAHAAATSVVSAPGSMYNPLFLYGAPGVGKTHFLNAVGKGLAGALGEGTVIMTSGSRLSNSVSRAVAAGQFGELRKFLSQAKGLVVDDVHLVAVTEQNRASLAEIFGMFFSSNLQVILSSIYPPRALGQLEDALKISLAKGWAVDLKVPNPMVQVDIVHGWFDRHFCPMTTDDARLFHERLGVNYFESLRWMRRLKVLSKLMQQGNQEPKPAEVLNILFDPGVTATDFPTAAQLETTKRFSPPQPGSDAIPLALIIPKGQESLVGWVAKSFYQAAKHYKLSRTYRHVLLQAYDAGQPFGVPFQIGDACQRAGAQAALVVGPPNDTNLAGRLAEFSHAVGHVLESLDMACGWIHHRGTMAPSPYLRAHLDFLAERK